MKKRDYAPDSQKMAGNEQIAQEVGKNPNGAGYVGLAYVKASGIKVVAIDGAMPSKESVLGKVYPYARQHFIIRTANQPGWRNNLSILRSTTPAKNCRASWICPDQIANAGQVSESPPGERSGGLSSSVECSDVDLNVTAIFI